MLSAAGRQRGGAGGTWATAHAVNGPACVGQRGAVAFHRSPDYVSATFVRAFFGMKPRIAVLGCGYWGSNHIRTLKALGALYAVSDANPARAEGFASEQDCLAIAPDELFDRADIDAIVMALPPQLHAEAAIRAVEAGKDVLVEKDRKSVV